MRSTTDRRAPLLVIARASPGDRVLAWTLLGIALPWLGYTRLYFYLQPRHLTFDGGFFMNVLNKPDPFCGGTRTFAWMWHGDIGRALAVYPLGPLLFVETFAANAYAGVILIGGRALNAYPTPGVIRRLVLIGFVALGFNWIAKLAWLGM